MKMRMMKLSADEDNRDRAWTDSVACKKGAFSLFLPLPRFLLLLLFLPNYGFWFLRLEMSESQTSLNSYLSGEMSNLPSLLLIRMILYDEPISKSVYHNCQYSHQFNLEFGNWTI